MMRNNPPSESGPIRQRVSNEGSEGSSTGDNDVVLKSAGSVVESCDSGQVTKSSDECAHEDQAVAAAALAELSRKAAPNHVVQQEKEAGSDRENDTERLKDLVCKEEKRLERNRVKARIARKRKKLQLTSLEEKINTVSRENELIKEQNAKLRIKLGQLSEACENLCQEKKEGPVSQNEAGQVVAEKGEKIGKAEQSLTLPSSSCAKAATGADQSRADVFSQQLPMSQAVGMVARPGIRTGGPIMVTMPMDARPGVGPMLLDQSGRSFMPMMMMNGQNTAAQRVDTLHRGVTMGGSCVYFKGQSQPPT